MFSKKAETQNANEARKAKPVKGAPSLISANLNVTGNLKTEGEVQIDGEIDGDVRCGKLTIGEQARVRGQVDAKEVVVRGRVEGRIRGSAIQLSRTAKVYGDIWHDTLAIEAGAYLEGHCKRNDSNKESLKATPLIADSSNDDGAGARARLLSAGSSGSD